MPDIFDASQKHPSQGSVSDTTGTTAVDTATEPETSAEVARRPRRHVDEYSEVLRQETATSGNAFQAWLPKPHKVFFDTQMSDEHVLLLLRRHPITQVPWILSAIGLALLPFLVAAVFPVIQFLPVRYIMAALIGWYALVFSFGFESFLMWFFNVYIITDERIIDVDFNSLIYKNISTAKLDNIEDITSTTGGAIRSIFDFGTIKIQTAAANAELEFEDVPHPAKVTSVLNELLLEEEREKLEGRVN